MKLTDFDFDLPERLIAVRPAKPRRASKLLVVTPDGQADHVFSDICTFLRPGDRLVMNDTKVIPARLSGHRTKTVAGQGDVIAKIEATLLEPTGHGMWRAMIKPLRKLAVGEKIVFSEGFSATCEAKSDGVAELSFEHPSLTFEEALNAHGAMPLPPYIASKRAADAQDMEDYQTVWAKHDGAVAAPTASLHFDETVLSNLKDHGVNISFVTLHVGAGTFLPVTVDDVKTHKMHAERGEITSQAAQEIRATQENGGRIIAVGTTALRLLETAATPTGLQAWKGATDIFIYPGYDFRVVDGLITNFHLPKSTLLMLISALMGKDVVDRAYSHAIKNNYRFFSYGDASLLLP